MIRTVGKKRVEKWRNRTEYLSNYKAKNGLYKGLSIKIYVNTCRITKELFVSRSKSCHVSKRGYELIALRKSNRQCVNCGDWFNKVINGRKVKNKYCQQCKADKVKVDRYNRKQERRKKERGQRIVKEEVYKRFSYICLHCGVNTYGVVRGINLPNEPTIDHVIPISKGGKHEYSNLQLLCRSCNSKKGNKL